MSRNFIQLNHGIIDVDLIIFVSDPFYILEEVKPKIVKTNTKSNKLGPAPKAKMKKIWAYDVMLEDDIRIRVVPTIVPFKICSNTKRFALRKRLELINLLKNEKENKELSADQIHEFNYQQNNCS